MKYTKLFSVLFIAIAVALASAKAVSPSGDTTKAAVVDNTLVGSTYASAVVNVTDVRSKLTTQNIYGETVTFNAALVNHVDLGASIDVARLADNKVDTRNFTGEVNTTVYTTFFGIKPYARGGIGWSWERDNAKKFQALTYHVGIGAEANVFKNLSVGAEVYLDDVQKAIAGGSQRIYKPYVTFWLNDHAGLTAAYVYNHTVNSAGGSAGLVFKF
jgi:hypothetical protein